MLCLLLVTDPACGMQTLRAAAVSQPTSTYTVGPGTIRAMRLLDLPFGKSRVVVTYEMDAGEVLEVSQPSGGVFLLEGMRGFLTYTTNPETIIAFRII